jgi:hypothetical protein
MKKIKADNTKLKQKKFTPGGGAPPWPPKIGKKRQCFSGTPSHGASALRPPANNTTSHIKKSNQ